MTNIDKPGDEQAGDERGHTSPRAGERADALRARIHAVLTSALGGPQQATELPDEWARFVEQLWSVLEDSDPHSEDMADAVAQLLALWQAEQVDIEATLEQLEAALGPLMSDIDPQVAEEQRQQTYRASARSAIADSLRAAGIEPAS